MDVFLSYAHEDAGFVGGLRDALTARGREVWVDVEGIEPADRWRGSAQEAIERSDAFVVVLSRAAVGSRACSEELDYAVSLNKRLIVVCVEQAVADTEKPSAVDELSWIMMRPEDDFERGVERLEHALDADLELVRTHTRILVRAKAWESGERRASPLLRGEELSAAEEWLSRAAVGPGPRPTDLQRDFIVASRRAVARRQRTIAAIASAVAMAGIGLAIFAFAQRSAAINNQHIAESRLLAAEAEQKVSSDASLSTLLALEALQIHETAQAGQALRDALANLQTLVTFSGDSDIVDSAVFSADGSRVLTGSIDGTARVWNARTDAQLLAIRTGGLIDDAAFSPDGTRIVTANNNDRRKGSSSVWNARTGRRLLLLRGGVGADVTAQFSLDGSKIVVASADGSVRIWNARTGTRVMVLRAGALGATSAALNRTGSEIVTTDYDNTVRVWNANTGAQLLVIRGQSLANDAAFSPDGSEIAVAEQAAAVFDARTGRRLVTLIDPGSGQPADATQVAFSPDGSRIVTTSSGPAEVWDTRTGHQIVVLGDLTTTRVDDANFNASGSRIVTGASDGTASIWDSHSLTQLLFESVPGAVTTAQFSPHGSEFFTVGTNAARLWATEGGERRRSFSAHPAIIDSGALSADGSKVVLAGADEAARVFDARTGRQLLVIRSRTPLGPVAFSPDGGRIASALLNYLDVWNSSTGELELHAPTGIFANDVAFSPDGSRILIVGNEAAARVYDARTGEHLLTLRGHNGRINSGAFSADGARIVTAGDDATARVWDARTGREIATLYGHAGPVDTAAFSLSGSLIATAGADDSVRLWNAHTYTQLLSFGQGPNDTGSSLAFSPNGQQLLVGTSGGTVHIYTTALTAPLTSLERLARTLVTRPFTSTERRIYLSGISG